MKGGVGLQDIHVMHRTNGASFVFHPSSFSLIRVNAEAGSVFADWENGRSIGEIAATCGLEATKVRELLQTLHQLIRSQAQKHRARLKSARQNMLSGQRNAFKLVLNVSNACNLRCRYCYAEDGTYGKRPSLMPGDLACLTLERIVDFFGAVAAVQFFGGEPTLNVPTMRSVCEYLQAMYQEREIPAMPALDIVTNGFAWSNEFLELVKRYNLSVTVSLDGPTSINDVLRITPQGAETFHQVASNIKRLQQYTNGKQPTKIEVTYTKRHVASGISFDDLYTFFAHEFGIQNTLIALVSLPKAHPAYSELALDVPLPSPLTEVSDDIVSSWASKHPRQFDVIYPYLTRLGWHRVARHLCGAGLTTLTVDAEGDIYPCFVLTQHDFRMGNIRAPDVFTSELFVRITEQFASHAKANLSNCPDCWARNFCHICFGVSNDATGSPWAVPTPWCDWMKRSVEQALVKLGTIYGDRERWAQLVRNAQRYDPVNNCFLSP